MTGRVMVVGSLNIDTLLFVERPPRVGESIHALASASRPGGKGGNQAVAAAAAGAETVMIGAVGADGTRYIRHLQALGVDVRGIRVLQGEPTGFATVIVGGDGENSVVVSEGSNAYVRAEQLDALHIREGDVVSLQYELPAEVVARVAEAASFAGATVLVNPSPWRADEAGILRHASSILVNTLEADQIAGLVPQDKLCVTAGSEGARWGGTAVPAPRITPVDTTGAGDCCAGTRAALLALGRAREEALTGAVAAASQACLQPGAQRWRSV